MYVFSNLKLCLVSNPPFFAQKMSEFVYLEILHLNFVGKIFCKKDQ